MIRRENWHVWLVRFANAANGMEYKIGKTDCVSITRRALQVIYATDPWEDQLPPWKTNAQAIRRARSVDPEKLLESTGAIEIPRNFATAGDIAWRPRDDHDGLPMAAVVLPARKALLSNPENGVQIVDMLSLHEDTRFYRYEW